MKRKFSKVLGVGLSFVLLVSLMAFAAPVSAGTLSFTTETIPGEPNDILIPGETIADLAASGDTAYAVVGTANKTYKTTNLGQTWKELSKFKATTSLDNVNFNLVAVAPDNPDVVAVVTENATPDQRQAVEYSVNGGSSWTRMVLASGVNARSIDISMERSDYRYIAVGGDNGTAGMAAMVYTMKLAAGEVWTQRALTANGFAASQSKISAVKWSPNFATDQILGVVSQKGTDNATFQVMWYDSKKWNSSVTGYEDYGTGIAIVDFTGTAALVSASITMHPEYLGTDEETRVVFVGVATANEGGVFRIIDDNQDKEVTGWTAASIGPVRSVAYDGTRLFAGEYGDNKVYVDDDPLATTPKFDKPNTYKQPGGSGPVIVALAGDTVVAGSGGNNGAFAVSTDDGYSFNDLSLINTELTNLRDVTPAMDNTKVYMSTDNGTFTSIWLKTSSWQRVLSIEDTDYIVRISPDDSSVVYTADKGGTDVYFSSNAGETSWKKRPAYKLDGIVDMVVESDLVAYAIDSNESSKTSNGGASWVTEKSLGVTANMISQAPNGDLLVGGSEGYVAFSQDGGSTWEKSEKQVGGGPGNVQVIADADYETNEYIYASTDYLGAEGIYRGLLATDMSFYSSSDHGLDLSATANQTVTGLATYGNTLYAIWYDATSGKDSYLERVLSPASTPPYYAVERASAAETFNVGPQALKVSDGVKLWVICTQGTHELYSLTDSIATVAPTLNAPDNGISVPVNPASGRAYDVTFSLDRPSSKVSELELHVYADSALKGRIYRKSFAVSATTKAITVGPHGMTGDDGETAEFMPAATYYWKARVSSDGPFYSPWSEVRSFTVEEVELAVAPAPVVTVTPPEVTVEPAPAPQVTVEVAPTPPTPIEVPPAIPTYLLWVIIGIGAVLVIAVIVLIVRTRRVA